mgnify:CR=1 FL=1
MIGTELGHKIFCINYCAKMAPQNLYSYDNDKWKTCFARSLPEDNCLAGELYLDDGGSLRKSGLLWAHYVLCPNSVPIIVEALIGASEWVR